MNDTSLGHNSGQRWIRLYVAARYHPIVGCGNGGREPWSKFEAWIDLIAEASWKQRHIVNKGRTILLERGELMAARAWLAQRWNWSEKQVRTFIDKLEQESMLAEVTPKLVHPEGQQNGTQKSQREGTQKGQQKTNQVRVLSISNYNIYQTASEILDLIDGQQGGHGQGQPLGQRKGQQQGQQRASEGPAKGQNSIKDRKDIRDISSSRARTRDELENLSARLQEVVGPSFNGAQSGFLTLAEPLSWLDSGCDLEMDIVPAIRMVMSAKRPARINGWWYFREAVREARDGRMQHLEHNGAQVPRPAHWRDEQRQTQEKSKANMAALRRQYAGEGDGNG